MNGGDGRGAAGPMSRGDGVPRAVEDLASEPTIAAPAAPPPPAAAVPAAVLPAAIDPIAGGGATLPAAAPPPPRNPARAPAAVAETLVGSYHDGTVAGPAGPRRAHNTDGDSTLPPAAGPADGDLPSFVRVDPSNYGIGKEIARGGMGRILAARDRRLHRDVVIKVTRDDGAWDPRFEREALITARLQHPSIVRVYEAGLLGDARAFYTMERVRGGSLEAVITATTTVRERIALLPHAIAVADAIAYAHSEGVVHRDLKPSNVLVGPFGETVVIDWGLAKDLRASDGSRGDESTRPRRAPSYASSGDLTMDGSVLGTPAYMAPEQARGEPAGPLCDVYALGALLYAMFSATAPYRARTGSEVLELVVAGQLVPIRERVPELPPELASIVERAMAHDPRERLQRASDLADELRRYAAGQLVASHTYSPAMLLRRWLWRHRATVGVAAAALVLIAALSALAVRRIVVERDAAAEASADAIAARAVAERLQATAELRADTLILDEAEDDLARDPSRTLGGLKRLSPAALTWPRARALMVEADRRGVAYELVGHDDDVELVELAADGHHFASGSDDATVRWWDLDALAHAPLVLRGPAGQLDAIAISPDSTLVASTGTDGVVWVWNTSTGAGHALRGHGDRVRNVVFSPDGRQLASVAANGTLFVWNTSTLEGRQLLRHGHELRPVAWTRDGKQLLIGTRDGSLGFVDPQTGAARFVPAHRDGIRTIATSPDGTRIATGTEDGAVLLWDSAGTILATLAGHTQLTRTVEFTPDSKRLVSAGGDQLVRVHTLADGGVIELRGNTSGIKMATISRDGAWVASAGLDNAVRIWPITGGAPRVLSGHTASVKAVEFTSNGHRLVSGSEDDRLRVWHLTPLDQPPDGDHLRAWLDAATNVVVARARVDATP
jgi:WD40 repeat protein